MTDHVGQMGERLGALADGHLGHDERDHALGHVAECAACLAELESVRRFKSQLSTLPGPSPSDALLARLLAVPGLDELAVPAPRLRPARARLPVPSLPGRRPAPGSARPVGRPDAGSPAARPRPSSRRRGRSSGIAGGVLAAAGVAVLGSVLTVGSAAGTGVRVSPPVSSLTTGGQTVGSTGTAARRSTDQGRSAAVAPAPTGHRFGGMVDPVVLQMAHSATVGPMMPGYEVTGSLFTGR